MNGRKTPAILACARTSHRVVPAKAGTHNDQCRLRRDSGSSLPQNKQWWLRVPDRVRRCCHRARVRASRWLTCPGRRKSQPQLLLALAERAQPQGVELDEARGVAMIVGDRAFLEGDEVLIVQRVLALASDHDDVSLVQFQAHAAR